MRRRSQRPKRAPKPPRQRPPDAFHRGHPLVYVRGDAWHYMDDLAPLGGTDGMAVERPCGLCGLVAEPNGPDPCLGRLPGVFSACCGHGVETPRVTFRLASPVRKDLPLVLVGDDALLYFRRWGVGPLWLP